MTIFLSYFDAPRVVEPEQAIASAATTQSVNPAALVELVIGCREL
jgi:hypothetical protein